MNLFAVFQFLVCLGDVDVDFQVMPLCKIASPDYVVLAYRIWRVDAYFKNVQRVPFLGLFIFALAFAAVTAASMKKYWSLKNVVPVFIISMQASLVPQ